MTDASDRTSSRYVGRLLKRNGAVGTWQVTHQEGEGGRFLPMESANLFPKGQASATHPVLLKAREGAVHLLEFGQASRGRSVYARLIGAPARIIPLVDLGRAEDHGAARRALASEPERFGAERGENAIRLPGDGLIVGTFEGESGALILTTPAGGVFPLRSYNADQAMKISDGIDFKAHYVGELEPPTGTFSWEDDLAVLERIVGVVATEGDGQPLRTAMELVGRALQATSMAEAANLLEGGRWSRLERILLGREEAALRFVSALSNHGEFARLRTTLIERLADSERERVGEMLMKKLAAEWADEFRKRRDNLERRLMEDIAANEERERRNLKERIDHEIQAAEAEKARRLATLKQESEKAAQDVEAETRRSREALAMLRTDAETLKREQTELRERRDDLVAQVQALKGGQQKPPAATGVPLLSFAPIVAEGEEIGPDEWRRRMKDLLLPSGLRSVTEMAILLSAGEVVALTGPDTDDLIRIYAHLTTAGRVATFHLDPTVIGFEDLLMRHPGGPSQFAKLLSRIEEEGGTLPTLVVFRNVEESARYWLPALMGVARSKLRAAGIRVALVVDEEMAKQLLGVPVISAAGAFEDKNRLKMIIAPPATSRLNAPVVAAERAVGLVISAMPKTFEGGERLAAIAAIALALAESDADALETVAAIGKQIDVPFSLSSPEANDD